MKVVIERFGINGEGVGHIKGGQDDGKVLFVDGAMPNESVDVEITHRDKKYCVGKVVKYFSTSEDRVLPRCKYYNICGGCNLQHIGVNTQKQLKLNNVKSTLEKACKIPVDISEIISDREYYYRNKMVFPVGIKDGKTIVGMFKGQTHEIIDIDKCLLAHDKIIEIFPIIKRHIEENFVGFDFEKGVGDIKYIVIREHDGAFLITLVVSKKLDLSRLYKVLCKHAKNIGLSEIISDSNEDILSGEYIHLFGEKYLEINDDGIVYKVDNRGFLQVNNNIKEKLYASVSKAFCEEDILLDGYSGAGLLTAILSQKCKKVFGVEINRSACDSAKKLFKENRIANVRYFCDNVKNIIDNCFKWGINSLVLDPPRSGVSKGVLESVLKNNNIKKICYVSCNPATLARDLQVLLSEYNIENIKLFDMFPQTKHVETLVVLERKREAQ